jgi:uncharacterized protein YneF (UPF0154 family)
MRQTENQSTRHETSDDALASISGTIAREVYRAIREQPRTVDELMQDMGLTHSTCSARVNQLMREGWIRDGGDRRFTRSLRDAIVWVACECRSHRPTGRRASSGSPRSCEATMTAESIVIAVIILLVAANLFVAGMITGLHISLKAGRVAGR